MRLLGIWLHRRFLVFNPKRSKCFGVHFRANGRQNIFSLKFNLNIIVGTVVDLGKKFHVNQMKFEFCKKKLPNGNFGQN